MKKNVLKKILLSLMALVLVFSFTACGNEEKGKTEEKPAKEVEAEKDGENKDMENKEGEEASNEEADAPKELEKMSIVLDWYPNAIHCFLYNAIEKGYFADEGIELEILFPANPNDGISMPAAGKADFGVYYMKDVIKSRGDNDVPVKSIGAILQKPVNVVVSLKEKNIKSPKDLKDKKVGYCGSDLSKQIIQEVMKHENTDSSGVEFIDVGFDLMNAMTTGQVDATIDCLENHEVPFMEKQGLELNYFNPNKFGIPDTYEMILISGDKTLEEKPEKVAGFLRACKKGFDDMKNDKKGSLDILFKNQNEENFPLDRDVEEQSLDILLSRMDLDGVEFLTQEDSVWQENIDWMKELGFLENDIKPADLIYKAE